jgi:hypothetical protein
MRLFSAAWVADDELNRPGHGLPSRSRHLARLFFPSNFCITLPAFGAQSFHSPLSLSGRRSGIGLDTATET